MVILNLPKQKPNKTSHASKWLSHSTQESGIPAGVPKHSLSSFHIPSENFQIWFYKLKTIYRTGEMDSVTGTPCCSHGAVQCPAPTSGGSQPPVTSALENPVPLPDPQDNPQAHIPADTEHTHIFFFKKKINLFKNYKNREFSNLHFQQ